MNPQRSFRPFCRLVFLFLLVFVCLGDLSAVLADTTGSITGRVTDQDTGWPLEGVTVVAIGPQGEFATLTETGRGTFLLRGLPLGDYQVWFFNGDVRLEHPRVTVSVGKTVWVDATLPATAVVENVIEVDRPADIDVGSTRIGQTLNRPFIENTPAQFQIGDMLDKAPGAFFDPVGAAYGGSTGAENNYLLDGVNVTGVGYGLLGSSLPAPFVDEVEIITGGYSAEYGRAMGGVVNVATKSGSNQFRGSVVGMLSPPFMNGNPRRSLSLGTVLSAATRKEWETNLAFEVGGPIVRDKLFFWVGYAPTLTSEQTNRRADRFIDADGDGQPDPAPGGGLMRMPLYDTGFAGGVIRHQYAGKLTFLPAPQHSLSLGVYGTLSSHERLSHPNRDLRSAQMREESGSTDVSLRWLSRMLNGRWRVEGNFGLHRETMRDSPLHADALARNEVLWFTGPSLLMFDMDPSVRAHCGINPMTGFNPCPVLDYSSGGAGFVTDITATRWSGQVKSTHTFFLGGRHEFKLGGDYELNVYDSMRAPTGPAGGRGWVLMYEGMNATMTTFQLPRGTRPYQFMDSDPGTGNADPNRDGHPGDLLSAPYYTDTLVAKTQTQNVALFAQEGWSPLPNLTLNVGVRWENQYLDDYLGERAMIISNNVAPRIGAIYDPTQDGRARLFGHFGRYYQSIPLGLNNRGFGGEGILLTFYNDPATCPGTTQAGWASGDPRGSWRQCRSEDQSYYVSGGATVPVQDRIRGSYTDEIVLGGEYALMSDMVFGVSYVNRTLGRIIEDADHIIANPGDIPDRVVQGHAGRADALAAAAVNGTPQQQADAAEAQFLANAVANVARFPRPRRTYNALVLNLRKRLGRDWMAIASYTHARTQGNYTGLYAADNDQLDPAMTTQFDTADLLANRNGPLPNDRPHHFRLDGFHQQAIGRGWLTTGLGFVAHSGRPNTALGTHPIVGRGEVFVLPRGSMGRSPVVTRFDLHLGYRMPITPGTGLEVFFDVFNLFNQRMALLQDNDYTLSTVNPIVGGDKEDLRHLKSTFGVPATPNPNFLVAIRNQLPISGRLGLRLTF